MTVSINVLWTSATAAWIGGNVDIDGAGEFGAKNRDQGFDLIDHFNGICIGLTEYRDRDGARAVVPVPGFADLDAVDDPRDVAELHWCAVAIGDNERQIS